MTTPTPEDMAVLDHAIKQARERAESCERRAGRAREQLSESKARVTREEAEVRTCDADTTVAWRTHSVLMAEKQRLADRMGR